MGFNYAKERRSFENEWKKLREQYREAGFSEEGINAMRAFDEEAFRSRRRYENHSQELPTEDFGEDDSENRTSLFEKFGSLTVTFDEGDFGSRYAWVDTVSNPDLAAKLKMLKASDLELLTLIVIEGYSQIETARMLGCSQKVISMKMTRIKIFSKKLNQWYKNRPLAAYAVRGLFISLTGSLTNTVRKRRSYTTHRVRYRPAPRARIVQRVIAGTGAPALSFFPAVQYDGIRPSGRLGSGTGVRQT